MSTHETCFTYLTEIIETYHVTDFKWNLHHIHLTYLLWKPAREREKVTILPFFFLMLFFVLPHPLVILLHGNHLFYLRFLFSLLSDRSRRCCSNNDSWTQRKRDSEPPGEEHYCDDVHNHRDTQLAEVCQPDLCGVCLHLLHCADDHLAGMAGLLLHPAIPLRKCQRQESGEQCWNGCLCFQKVIMGFNLK